MKCPVALRVLLGIFTLTQVTRCSQDISVSHRDAYIMLLHAAAALYILGSFSLSNTCTWNLCTQMLKCFEVMVINVQITIRKDGDVALAAPKKKKRQKTEKRQEGMERLCGVWVVSKPLHIKTSEEVFLFHTHNSGLASAGMKVSYSRHSIF